MFVRRVRAAFEMAHDVGVAEASERVWRFALARLEERHRRRQFRRLNLRSPEVREILGNRMLLDPSREGIDCDLLANGIREPVATGHLMQVLRPDDVVLEIGANIGYYALIEAKICQKIYAAEPHPDNYARLLANLSRNNVSNVETFQIAFSSKDGDVYLSCSERSNWHSCKGVTENTNNAIKVEARSVDSFFAEREPPSVMKMDVEGYEIEVLRGATHTLKGVRELFFELHGDKLTRMEIAEALDIISSAGLTPSLIVQYDWPGMSRIYPMTQIETIHAGDRGTYELFFSRSTESRN